jgi:hypothetical protein
MGIAINIININNNCKLFFILRRRRIDVVPERMARGVRMDGEDVRRARGGDIVEVRGGERVERGIKRERIKEGLIDGRIDVRIEGRIVGWIDGGEYGGIIDGIIDG